MSHRKRLRSESHSSQELNPEIINIRESSSQYSSPFAVTLSPSPLLSPSLKLPEKQEIIHQETEMDVEKIQNTNILYNLETCNDFQYFYPFNIKKQKLIKLLANKTHLLYKNKDVTPILKTIFATLNLEDDYFDFIKICNDSINDDLPDQFKKYKYFDYDEYKEDNERDQIDIYDESYEEDRNIIIKNQEIDEKKSKEEIEILEESDIMIGGRKKNLKKYKNKLKKGGAETLETICYFKNQHIFDNRHDFLKKPLFKEVQEKNKKISKSLYTIGDLDLKDLKNSVVSSNFFKDLYNKGDDRYLFFEMIKKNSHINEKLFFLSIYHLVDKNIKLSTNTDIGNEFKPEEIDILKLNLKDFFEKLNLKEGNYVLDANLNFGAVDKNLNHFIDKIKERIKLLNIVNFDALKIANEKKNYLKITHEINDFLKTKSFYSVEQSYDSLGVSKKEIDKFLNESHIKDNIECLGFISALIFSSNIIPTSSNIPIHKAFSSETIKIFDVVYYIDQSDNNKVKSALIFKDKTILNFLIKNDKFKSIIDNDLLILNKNPDPDSYLYSYKKPPVYTNPNLFYGFNLEIVKNFNSISTIIKYINLIYTNDDCTVKNILEEYTKMPNPNKKNYTVDKLIFVFILLYIILSNITGTNKIKELEQKKITELEQKKIVSILFDLKKSSDLAKVLFTYYYNLFKFNKSLIPNSLKLKFNDIETYFSNLNFSSNDKLAVLSSMLKENTSVVFADATNFSIFIYNTNDTLFSYANLITWFNIYFMKIFLTDISIEIIQDEIDVSILDVNIKKLNYIFTHIPHEKINLFINKTDLNSDNILSDIKEEVKNGQYPQKINLNESINDLKKLSNINFKNLLNDYIKIVFTKFIKNVIKNIEVNLKKEKTINFFIKKVLFDKIIGKISKQLFALKNNKLLLCFKLIVKTILTIINKNIEKILNDILKFVENHNFLENPTNIRSFLTNINKILKIIQIFVYYDDNETNLKTLFGSMNNINNFIDNIFTFDNPTINTTKPPPPGTVSLKLLKDVSATTKIMQGIYGSLYTNNTINQENIYQKTDTVFNSFFKYYKDFTYILNINTFFSIFDDIEKSNPIQYGVNIKNIKNLFKYIKKIYSYSYIQIHSDLFKTDFEDYMKKIMKVLKGILNDIKQQKPLLADFIEKSEEQLINKIESTMKNLSKMQQNIIDHDITDENIEIITFNEGITDIVTSNFSDKFKSDIEDIINKNKNKDNKIKYLKQPQKRMKTRSTKIAKIQLTSEDKLNILANYFFVK